MGLAISSGILTTGTTSLITGKGILSGIIIVTDNTNIATVTVYDNPSAASGTVLAKCTATSTIGANSLAFVTPVRFDTGLTVVVTGTGSPQAIVYHSS